MRHGIIASMVIGMSIISLPARGVEIVDNSVYRIDCNYLFSNTQKSMQAPATSGTIAMAATDTEATNAAQLWIISSTPDGDSYYIRSLSTGCYMTSPIQKNAAWVTTATTDPDKATMAFVFAENGGTTISPTGYDPATNVLQDGFAHGNGNGGSTLICYGNGAEASKWTLTKVDVAQEDIDRLSENWFPHSIKNNTVYRIVNGNYGHAAFATNGTGDVNCDTPADTTDPAHLWVTQETADGSGIYLRNYLTGQYLTSPCATRAYWTAKTLPDHNASRLTLAAVTEGVNSYTITTVGNTLEQGYAHEDNVHRMYSWDANNASSRWSFNIAHGITEEELEAQMQSWAQNLPPTAIEITDGSVYRLCNVQYGKYMVPNANGGMIAADLNEYNLAQLWIVEANEEGTGYSLINYKNGATLTSSMGRSSQWSAPVTLEPDPTKTVMSLQLASDGWTIAPLSAIGQTDVNSTHGYAHQDGSSNIVGWNTDALPTKWYFQICDDITPEDVENQRSQWSTTQTTQLQPMLRQMFVDNACTQLNATYAAMSVDEIQADATYLALPEVLQQMVIKVRTDNWAETDPTNPDVEWDSDHARKFRVQLYEPYSECNSAASLTAIQAYTNMNNPTGILSDAGTTLYVMVDQMPADGSYIYMRGLTGDGSNLSECNNATLGTQLHEGLNVIHCDADVAHQFVYYWVDASSGRERLRPVTDFDDIKIHIEGGSLNGYFSSEGDALYTPDTNEDWLYYRERARHPMFDLLSKYTILRIHFFDVTEENGSTTTCLKSRCTPEELAAGNYDLIATLRAWDEMVLSELMLMGLRSDEEIIAEQNAGHDFYEPLAGDDIAPNDYYKYFNNRMMGITMQGSLFMNATWYRTAYNVSTIESIIKQFPTGDLWGPAHEFGHMNQGPMKIAGTTEESNNVFSNVAVYYRGKTTSRADMPSAQQTHFNNGDNFHQNDTWGTTRMWFQLWLYYHAAGNNKKFYPRLYELLRENPLQKSSTAHLNAKDDLLHFAKMCCLAAGEDLTDFFESWGFFVEQDGYFIGDYTSYTSYLSAEDIAEWKAEVAALDLPKNTAIIFIDDRPGSDRESYSGFPKENAGTMGGLNDFINGADVTGNYTFSVTGTTVTVSGGSGGVGFAIHDANGKLIGFGNEATFEVSPETAALIASGEVTFDVIDSENNTTEVADIVRSGSLTDALALYPALFEKVEALLAKSDPDGNIVGYMKPEIVADLRTLYSDVKARYEADEITAEDVATVYADLSVKYLDVYSMELTADNCIAVVPGAIYVFTSNLGHPGEGVKTDGNALGYVPAGEVDLENETQQFRFEPAEEENYFYIRSIANGKYIGKTLTDRTAIVLTDSPIPQKVTFRGLGGVSISAEGVDSISLHNDGNNRIVRWSSSNAGSHWTLTRIPDSDLVDARFNLDDLIARAEELLAEVGSIAYAPMDNVALSADRLYSNATYTANNNSDTFTTWDNVLDGNVATYFHSDYSGSNSADGLNHYIRAELPDEVTLGEFYVNYTTRDADNPPTAPTQVEIQCASEVDGEWTTVLNVTSGLTTSRAATNIVGPATAPAGTRYVRMVINANSGNVVKGGHPYFVVSEFGITNGTDTIATPDETYLFVTAEMMTDLFSQTTLGHLVTDNSDATVEQLTNAYNQILPAYETLLEARDMNENRLRELIDKTRQLADVVGDVDDSVTPLAIGTENYYSNAPHTADGSDKFTSWTCLTDGNPDTYFHSRYNGDSDDGDDHYIRLLLPEFEETTRLILTFTTRNNASATWTPTEAEIQVSPDATEWTTVHTLTEELPRGAAEEFFCESFEVDPSVHYVRFIVHANRMTVNDSRTGSSEGHAYFVLSELGMSTHSVLCEPNTAAYPKVTTELMTNALVSARAQEGVLNRPSATPANYNAAYEALLPHYEALYAASNDKGTGTGIDDVNATEESAPTVIYDMRGVRLSRITRPGIYIINGQKVRI